MILPPTSRLVFPAYDLDKKLNPILTSVWQPEVSLAGIRLSDGGAEFPELFSFPSELFPFG